METKRLYHGTPNLAPIVSTGAVLCHRLQFDIGGKDREKIWTFVKESYLESAKNLNNVVFNKFRDNPDFSFYFSELPENYDDEDLANVCENLPCYGGDELDLHSKYKEARRCANIFLGSFELASSFLRFGERNTFFPAVIGFDIPAELTKPLGDIYLVKKEVPLKYMKEVYTVPDRPLSLEQSIHFLKNEGYEEVDVRELMK